ncbi:MAG: cyclic pyranopterin monophosphate synthase MoaC [Candidatus Dormibacteria bacterium]
MAPRLTHIDRGGAARMVDVSPKPVTARAATASCRLVMSTEAFAAVSAGNLPKGDLVAVTRIAGIMAAKRTSELIPLCHPLRLTHVDVEVELEANLPGLRIRASVTCEERTGAEMEALTACAVAALTGFDMVKAVDPWARVEGLGVERKAGGRRGAVARPQGAG